MAVQHSGVRRIAGWTCIALGKIGSLLLLWAIVSGAEPDVGEDAMGTDAVFGLFGIALFGIVPLFAMTLGAVAIGLRILMGNERT